MEVEITIMLANPLMLKGHQCITIINITIMHTQTEAILINSINTDNHSQVTDTFCDPITERVYK